MAVASITAAVRGLHTYSTQWPSVLSTLAAAVNLDAQALLPVVQQIDVVMEKAANMFPGDGTSQQQQPQQQPLTPTNKQQPSEPMEVIDQNVTPTNLTEIRF